MKLEDFREITPEMIRIVKIMLKNEGICEENQCKHCPFNDNVNYDCACLSENAIIANKQLLNWCYDFLELTKDMNKYSKEKPLSKTEEDKIKKTLKDIRQITEDMSVEIDKRIRKNLLILKAYCTREMQKEADLWKATKALFELFNMDWKDK